MSNDILELSAVQTHIGAYHILHGVDLQVPAGQVTMLLGRNGAGKTTTLVADLDPRARDLEGYLFPDTYTLARKASAETLVAGMVERFRAIAGPGFLGLAAEQALTIPLFTPTHTEKVAQHFAFQQQNIRGVKRFFLVPFLPEGEAQVLRWCERCGSARRCRCASSASAGVR